MLLQDGETVDGVLPPPPTTVGKSKQSSNQSSVLGSVVQPEPGRPQHQGGCHENKGTGPVVQKWHVHTHTHTEASRQAKVILLEKYGK